MWNRKKFAALTLCLAISNSAWAVAQDNNKPGKRVGKEQDKAAEQAESKSPLKKPDVESAKAAKDGQAESWPGEELLSLWRKQALYDITFIMSEADKVEGIRDSVYIKSRACKILWDRDLEAVRAEFLRTAEAIENYTSDELTPQQLKWLRHDLWAELIKEAVRHDTAFASKLEKLKAEKEKQRITDQPAEAKVISDGQWFKADMLAQLAAEALQDGDPKQALTWVKESLSVGAPVMKLANLMIPLRTSLGAAEVDPVFEGFLKLMVMAPRPTPVSLNVLAVYAFPDLQAGLDRREARTAVRPAVVQMFVATALAVLTESLKAVEALSPKVSPKEANVLKSQAYAVAARLQPRLEQYATPDQAKHLNSIVAGLGERLGREQRQSVDSFIQPQPEPSKLLESAEKEYNPYKRDGYYQGAVTAALRAGDHATALDIASRIYDPQMRQFIEREINLAAVYREIGKGNFHEALTAARRLMWPERVSALSQIAQAVAEKGDKDWAMTTLLEAEYAAEKMDNSLDKSARLGDVARAYLAIEPERAFEVLSTIVSSANGAFDIDGKSIRVRSDAGESFRLPNNEVRVAGLLNVDHIFEVLAGRDYMRANLIAQSLTRRELRLNAQLAVCRGILKSEKRNGKLTKK